MKGRKISVDGNKVALGKNGGYNKLSGLDDRLIVIVTQAGRQEKVLWFVFFFKNLTISFLLGCYGIILRNFVTIIKNDK